jgi:tight adherence protein B
MYLLYGFVGLALLGFTAWLVIVHIPRHERMKARLAAAAAPYQRVRRVEAPRMVRTKVPERTNSPLHRVSGLFGFDPDRQEQYPIKWWVLLLITAFIARLVAGVIVGLVGPSGWISLPAIWILGTRTVFNMMALRRRAKLYGQFPDCLSMIVRSVRAGVPLTEAIRIVAREIPTPSAEEFSRVAGDLAIGTPISDALKSLADRNDITEFRFFATALTLQAQTGGRLGETLDNLGSIVRKRMALKSRGRALASEARTTALILGCLPVLAGGALYLLNPAYVDILFYDPSGQMVLASALTSLGIGAFIMRTIIEKTLK